MLGGRRLRYLMTVPLFLSTGGEISQENGAESNSDLTGAMPFPLAWGQKLVKANDRLEFIL